MTVPGRTSPDLRFLLAHPAHFFALGFGSGLAPWAPGTFGTLAALPLFGLLQALLPQPALLAALAGLFVLGIPLCQVAGRHLGVADHGAIVWDEIVAVCLVWALLPQTALWLALGFIAFRFFDILKPWPIRYFDARLKNGFGVMFDDLLAAGYSLLLLKGLQWLA